MSVPPVVVESRGVIRNVSIFGEASGAIASAEIHNAGEGAVVTWAYSGPWNMGVVSSWTDADEKLDLHGGVYRMTVASPDGRSASAKYTVLENRKLRVLPGKVFDVVVYGRPTGKIARTQATGGDGRYLASWSSTTGDGATDVSSHGTLRELEDLYAGSYTVRIRDGVGATAEHTYEVAQTRALRLRPGRVSNVPLYGRSEAGGDIGGSSVHGGTPPYRYMWSGSGEAMRIPAQVPIDRYDVHMIHTVRDLRQGKYVLTVWDAVGATATHTFTISEGPEKQYKTVAGTRNIDRISD